MSKLGKKPMLIPKETKVKVESGKLILTGPKGSKEDREGNPWHSC